MTFSYRMISAKQHLAVWFAGCLSLTKLLLSQLNSSFAYVSQQGTNTQCRCCCQF